MYWGKQHHDSTDVTGVLGIQLGQVYSLSSQPEDALMVQILQPGYDASEPPHLEPPNEQDFRRLTFRDRSSHEAMSSPAPMMPPEVPPSAPLKKVINHTSQVRSVEREHIIKQTEENMTRLVKGVWGLSRQAALLGLEEA